MPNGGMKCRRAAREARAVTRASVKAGEREVSGPRANEAKNSASNRNEWRIAKKKEKGGSPSVEVRACSGGKLRLKKSRRGRWRRKAVKSLQTWDGKGRWDRTKENRRVGPRLCERSASGSLLEESLASSSTKGWRKRCKVERRGVETLKGGAKGGRARALETLTRGGIAVLGFGPDLALSADLSARKACVCIVEKV